MLLLSTIVVRYAEFGRAISQRILRGETTPRVIYYGMFRKSQASVIDSVQNDVFKHWDDLPSSPPKRRPTPENTQPPPVLNLLTFSGGVPGWPAHISQKFDADSPEARNLQKLKEEFEVLCPNRPQAPGPVSVAVPPPRVAGAPDFNVDGGATPLDIDRVVDLEKVSVPDAADRRGFSNRMVFIFRTVLGFAIIKAFKHAMF